MARVLIVGRGAPERGGIRTAMETLLDSDLGKRHRLGHLNLGRERGTEGGKPTFSNLVRTVQDLRAMWQEARGMDVVHIHTAFAPGVTALRAAAMSLAAKLRGTFVVIHIHGGRFPGWVDARSSRSLVTAVSPCVGRFAAVSRGSAEALTAVIGPGKVSLVPNGIDTLRFRPSEPAPGPPVVLYVGVLSPRKGLLDLFEASRRLRAGGIEHRLWLVGGVPDEGMGAYEEVTAAAPGWVRFLDEVGYGELPEIYAQAAIFCLPSWWEAAPLTVMEGAAAGLPVVATRVGDVPHLVEDGVTGLVVEPREPDGLAAALGKLVESEQLRREMGARARRMAEEKFSISAYVDAVDDIYEGVR